MTPRSGHTNKRPESVRLALAEYADFSGRFVVTYNRKLKVCVFFFVIWCLLFLTIFTLIYLYSDQAIKAYKLLAPASRLVVIRQIFLPQRQVTESSLLEHWNGTLQN